jgi:type IV pilus assembly protein PilB
MLSAFAQKSFLGEQLINAGIITREQLEKTLMQQRQRKDTAKSGVLGQLLVENGYCSEEDIARIIAKNTGSYFITLSSHAVDMSAANLITPEIAVKYQALPIGFENGKLLVAMRNPRDVIALDDLRILTGYEIATVTIPDRELDAAIKQFENSSMSVETHMDEEQPEELDQEAIEAGQMAEQPAVQLANQIFNQSIKAGASDVHIEPQEKKLRIRFRIDGVLHEVMNPPHKLQASLISRIKVMSNMDIAERRIPQDGRITMKVDKKVIDVRVASLPSAYGEKLTLRLLNRNDKLITLQELGFPKGQLSKYNKTIRLPYGFILITGPTGSGKSTTLYATLAKLNSPDKNVITLEDPIERRMDGLNQIQVNVKAGMTFASGLRSILRSDPDIIMVGEIRDHETARIAVESALTGHLVLSTLHTNDAAGAITRLIDMGIEPYLISSSLVGVVAQRLVRVLCPNCKVEYTVGREELLKSVPDFPIDKDENELKLYRAKGCISCSGTGYRGRKGVFEFLPVTETIQPLILQRASTGDIKMKAISEGMTTLRADGLRKVREGLTTVEEVLRVVV